mgnify:FL=1|jgi:Fe-S cluster biogenesis protein NfuA|tara:strand:- start:30248 stop:30829 length:582 start_codon:yes stop_codon:yes gene_type:complete
MLYTIYAESTPNPTTMKFVANKKLVNQSIEAKSPEEAKKINIAQKLFMFPFVENVFLSNNFISITKNRSVEWQDIAMQLREFILDFINNNKIEILGHPKDISINSIKIKKKKVSNSEIDNQIISLIDNYIKPAVESDGGAIEFHSFENGTVTVILKGSCSGCPSSQATLKNGVEQLLKDKIGEKVSEVIALNQ